MVYASNANNIEFWGCNLFFATNQKYKINLLKISHMISQHNKYKS